MSKERRYYYRTKKGNSYLSLKTPLSKEEEKEYDVITEEEWNAHVESIKPKKPTAAQKARKEKLAQISKAKAYLSSTDYCVIKIAEGVATAEEYAEVLVKRAEARTTINTLEEELA